MASTHASTFDARLADKASDSSCMPMNNNVCDSDRVPCGPLGALGGSICIDT